MKLRYGKFYDSKDQIVSEQTNLNVLKSERRRTFHVADSRKKSEIVSNSTDLFQKKSSGVIMKSNIVRRHSEVRSVKRNTEDTLEFSKTINRSNALTTSTPYNGHTKPQKYANKYIKTEAYQKEISSSNVESIDFSIEHNNSVAKECHLTRSLEENLFHDMSLVKTSEYFSKGFQSDDNKFYKLDNSFLSDTEYSDYNDGFENNILSSVNHVKRSIFRQKRREWYLQRYNGRKRILPEKKSRHFIIKFVYRVITIFQLLTRYVSHIFQKIFIQKTIVKVCGLSRWAINGITSFSVPGQIKNRKSINIGVSDISSNVHEKGKSFISSFCLWCVLVVLLFPLIFFPYAKKHPAITDSDTKSQPELSLPTSNPLDVGLMNAFTVLVNGTPNTPVWVVYPGEEQSSEHLGPSILHLRLAGSHSEEKRISVYKILASLGYHVVVPNMLISQNQVVSLWSWMKIKSLNKPLYLWGDELSTSEMKELAKSLCDKLMPPSGVIIEVVNKYTSLQHRSLEVWSCNCTSVYKDDGSYHSYNHVKCPVSVQSLDDDNRNDLYNQLVSCVQVIHNKV